MSALMTPLVTDLPAWPIRRSNTYRRPLDP
jgi:hypothetical protein